MKITRKELREIIEEVATELGVFEGNAFGDAVRKAKEAGEDEFEVDGKTFKVKEALTKKQEKLPEPLKKAILKKQGEDPEDSADEEEDVKEALTKKQEKLPEPLKKAILKKQGETVDEEEETIEEGNAWGDAVRKAKEEQLEEFEFNGKTYQVLEAIEEDHEPDHDDTEEFVGDDDEDVEEGNAFGDAVRKAKEAGEDEFEVDGKTFKVKEAEQRGVKAFKECTLSETFARISGNKKVIHD